MKYIGGPYDGREVTPPESWGTADIVTIVAIPPKRHANEDDAFDPITFEFVDPELNVRFETHRYDGRTGEYIGPAGDA